MRLSTIFILYAQRVLLFRDEVQDNLLKTGKSARRIHSSSCKHSPWTWHPDVNATGPQFPRPLTREAGSVRLYFLIANPIPYLTFFWTLSLHIDSTFTLMRVFSIPKHFPLAGRMLPLWNSIRPCPTYSPSKTAVPPPALKANLTSSHSGASPSSPPTGNARLHCLSFRTPHAG